LICCCNHEDGASLPIQQVRFRLAHRSTNWPVSRVETCKMNGHTQLWIDRYTYHIYILYIYRDRYIYIYILYYIYHISHTHMHTCNISIYIICINNLGNNICKLVTLLLWHKSTYPTVLYHHISWATNFQHGSDLSFGPDWNEVLIFPWFEQFWDMFRLVLGTTWYGFCRQHPWNPLVRRDHVLSLPTGPICEPHRRTSLWEVRERLGEPHPRAKSVVDFWGMVCKWNIYIYI
jgi:hypothetical protein